MNSTSIQNLITSQLAEFGNSVLVIITAVISIAIAYLIFKYGWRIMNDQSLQFFGFYVRKTPYAGYNRFRTKAWNMKNTM